jgi:signal transduction histidine kinase
MFTTDRPAPNSAAPIQLAPKSQNHGDQTLAHVNRFSTAGELTASIAHELNQPLGVTLTNAETIEAILILPLPIYWNSGKLLLIFGATINERPRSFVVCAVSLKEGTVCHRS